MYNLTNKEKLKHIVKFSKELGVTAYEFGEKTNITAVGARNILEGESKNPRTRNLNMMLKYLQEKQMSKKNYTSSENLSILQHLDKIAPIKTQDQSVVPFYNIEISGTNISNFDDANEFIEFYIDYKPLNDCTAYLPYFGDSMYPMFKSGSTLAVKQIHNFEVILWGEAHLIITSKSANSYKTVKCVHAHPDSDKIILRACNPKHPGDIVINKKDILSLFIVKGEIKLSEL